MDIEEIIMEEMKEQILNLIKQEQWNQIRQLEWGDYLIPDVASLLIDLNKSERVILFRLLPRPVATDVFSYLEKEDRNSLLKDLTNEETRYLLTNLRPDDRTALFEELPGQVTQRLLNLLSPEDMKEARLLLGYPEESVGRLMTPEYVAVRPQWTIQEAINHIRVKARNSETLHTIYITDKSWKLLDSLELSRFILADPQDTVETIMDNSFVSLSAFDDREMAVRAMQKYDVFSLPVVDSGGILLGLVTFDDVMDVAEEEATEDFHKTAAVTPLKASYQESSIKDLVGKRITWLIALVLISLFSAGIIAIYEETLQTVIVLAIFIPLLLGSGGNAGAQASTLMVRAIATSDVHINEWLEVFLKELMVGLLLGLLMGIIGLIFGSLRGGFEIGLIVGLTMLTVVLAANLIGVMLPFLLTKMGLDPAVASNPLITSITDVLGLLIYFAIAAMVLGGL
ncbi:MAG: magnesium transporter [Syntrophomonadaceae bacterium]|jgi:magnesium transporter|nr:magnesium transporter [Syntrophomonadaceae bacterium]